MRSLTIDAALRSAWAAPIWMALLSLVATDNAARSADDVTLDQIRTAWHKRLESIKSFQYECQLEQILVKGSRNEIARRSPSASKEDVPNEDVTLRQTFMFCLSGNKMACSQEGEQWDDISNKRKAITFKVAFDTVHARQLVEGSSMPMGEIVSGGEMNDMLTNYANSRAIWLWLSPAPLLQLQGYAPEKMTISKAHAFRAGHDCIELSLPAQNGSSWRALIWVDPLRDYVPLQFIRQHEGVTRLEMSIEYVRDEQVGWRVSEWNDKWFHQSGALDRSTSCEMKRCSVNEPLDDDPFTFEFPEGAHVIERDGQEKKYFIALADAKRRYISENQYGRPPEDEHYMPMKKRVSAIGNSTEAERKAILAELKQYASDHPSSVLVVDLSRMTARRLFHSERPELAVEFCREFVGISRVLDYYLTGWAAEYEGELRRNRLVGNPIKLTGKTIDGQEFDWTKFLGKVVLVEFWFTGCKPCREQMPHIKKLYEAYHGRGFDIVGVSVDSDAGTLREYLTKAAIPWTTIHERLGSVGSNTLRYRVRSFPTRILVDRAGKVVSLEASGEELDRLLLELVGPAGRPP